MTAFGSAQSRKHASGRGWVAMDAGRLGPAASAAQPCCRMRAGAAKRGPKGRLEPIRPWPALQWQSQRRLFSKARLRRNKASPPAPSFVPKRRLSRSAAPQSGTGMLHMHRDQHFQPCGDLRGDRGAAVEPATNNRAMFATAPGQLMAGPPKNAQADGQPIGRHRHRSASFVFILNTMI
jgi:hypothetical protein